jgi:hypothetical protein
MICTIQYVDFYIIMLAFCYINVPWIDLANKLCNSIMYSIYWCFFCFQVCSNLGYACVSYIQIFIFIYLYQYIPVLYRKCVVNVINLYLVKQPIMHTRNSNILQYQLFNTRTNYFKYSYFPHKVVLWNALSQSTLMASNLDQFNQYIPVLYRKCVVNVIFRYVFSLFWLPL